jgi:hypothetical protein
MTKDELRLNPNTQIGNLDRLKFEKFPELKNVFSDIYKCIDTYDMEIEFGVCDDWFGAIVKVPNYEMIQFDPYFMDGLPLEVMCTYIAKEYIEYLNSGKLKKD